MANSISFDSTDLSGSSYGITLMEHNYPVFNKPKLHTINAAKKHGGYTQGGELEPATLSTKVLIEGTSFSNLQTKIDNLNLLMAPELGDKSIALDYITDRYWLGRISGPFSSPVIGTKKIVTNLDFILADPLAYGTSEHSHTDSISGSSGTVYSHDTSGEVVPGTAEVYPTIVISPQGSGETLTSCTLYNLGSAGTNAPVFSLKVTRNISSGHYLRIDCENELIEYSNDGTNYATDNAARDNVSRTFPYFYPQLTPSLNDFTISVEGSTDTDVTVTYRARYR